MSQLVVILDEGDAVFDTVAKWLEDAGYLVLPLSTADEIVDELKVTQAAALLLDLRVGASTTSMDVITLLEQDIDLCSLPVLAYSEDTAQLEALRPQLLARGYGVLQKPFAVDDVLQWLRERVA